MDIYEDRKGYYGEPLGDFALKLFSSIVQNKDKIVISSLLIKELEKQYSMEEISGMMKPFEALIEKCRVSDDQERLARRIGKERDIPPGDVLHAIVARDNNCVLITRDHHFKKIEDLKKHYKPEEFM